MADVKEKLLPLSLTGFILLCDQLSKAFIVKNWPQQGLIKDVFNNDFLWIYHVRNPVIAFSLGERLPDVLKPVVFIFIPILVLGFLAWYYFKSKEFSKLQLWAAAGVLGGGIGNLIDRIFRPDGVVDFISVKFFKFIISSGRWPTFNIADSTVVICCILLFVSTFFDMKKNKKEKTNE